MSDDLYDYSYEGLLRWVIYQSSLKRPSPLKGYRRNPGLYKYAESADGYPCHLPGWSEICRGQDPHFARYNHPEYRPAWWPKDKRTTAKHGDCEIPDKHRPKPNRRKIMIYCICYSVDGEAREDFLHCARATEDHLNRVIDVLQERAELLELLDRTVVPAPDLGPELTAGDAEESAPEESAPEAAAPDGLEALFGVKKGRYNITRHELLESLAERPAVLDKSLSELPPAEEIVGVDEMIEAEEQEELSPDLELPTVWSTTTPIAKSTILGILNRAHDWTEMAYEQNRRGRWRLS